MYPVELNMTPGDLRRGRMHHAAIAVITPLSPVSQSPAELANKMTADADFVLETAIGTVISQLEERKATQLEIERFKKLTAKNVRQKIVQRCNVGRGPWQR
jgi:hypothetical protein